MCSVQENQWKAVYCTWSPPLVKSRVSYTTPFSVAGVDFMGALYVHTNEGESKVYLCLFPCSVCWAVHLEIVNDLTIECFPQAFHRLAGQGSLPKLLLSDNGSTFVVAEEFKGLLSSNNLTESLAHKGVEWQFIPKHAPWFGGFWEWLIGLTKSTIKKILGRTHATLEGLQSVEATLNECPLTYLSSDANDPELITPSHLLYGKRMVTLPHCTTESDEIDDPHFGAASELQRWARAQAVVINHFQNCWRQEYLTA